MSSVRPPPPSDVRDALGRGFSDLDLWNAIVATLVRLAEGWALGAGVAVLSGS